MGLLIAALLTMAGGSGLSHRVHVCSLSSTISLSPEP
ncbi:MAG: hypothetical protein ACRD2I_00180 [Vicinamibacterales bacterium]